MSLVTENAPTNVLNKLEHCTRPYTPKEALTVLIDRKLTVKTYNFLRLDIQDRGYDAFPPYYQVQQARNSCYPADMTISEIEASVPFQNLLQHTFDQILK